MEEKKVYLYLGILLFLDALLIFSLSNILSIETYKIETFRYMGFNEFTFRSIFLFLHFCNALLLFVFSKNFLKRPSDALFCTLLFLLLPGVNLDIIMFLKGQVIIFFPLLLCLLQQKSQKIPYWLLAIMAILDKSFSLVFLALIFYGISKKDTFLILSSLAFFALNMYLFGLNIGGYPRGYFIDTSAYLLFLFSPLVFLYFLYVLYRFINTQNKPLIWYISITTLCFILLLSLRQKVDIPSFAPLLIVSLPLMTKLYFCGLRVRLPQFRMRYKAPFIITFIVLLAFTFGLFFSKPLMLLRDTILFASQSYETPL
ncbi:hypothetical protein [Helicobacter apodemus]|uniref:Glycosyltransferase RgtA/B/C/D-like domain-containing protein n=1 Tax=Helicobacter apodemus TaxID=135569 RepID=A0A2U8FEH1_9HELI|nr:hypothetical protein [Helicobacter apodemus]AWI34534.1 hypothetical protein CDV25_06965 [Helicobacter apodemus]